MFKIFFGLIFVIFLGSPYTVGRGSQLRSDETLHEEVQKCISRVLLNQLRFRGTKRGEHGLHDDVQERKRLYDAVRGRCRCL